MGLSRRDFLWSSAAAAGGVLAACGPGVERFRGLRTLFPPDEAGAPSTGKRLSFCALGDWGHPDEKIGQVIEKLRSTGHAQRSDFFLLLGDNFYDDGVRSTTDPRWRTDFEEAFAGDAFDRPFYAVLGNHDHRGNVAAQVEYSALSKRWRMPGFYYAEGFDVAGERLLDLFSLDTTPLHLGVENAESQLRWLDDRLATSRARWRIVAGHHPLLSGGTSDVLRHGRKELAEIFERRGVHAYLAGHDHDLELLESPAGWYQIVSGSASHPRAVTWTPESLLACGQAGYARLTVTPEDLHVDFVTVERGTCASFALSALRSRL